MDAQNEYQRIIEAGDRAFKDAAALKHLFAPRVVVLTIALQARRAAMGIARIAQAHTAFSGTGVGQEAVREVVGG